MAQLRNIFSTRWGIVAVGALIGILATLLQNCGNPGNMGICVACFERDIAGAPSGCTGPTWCSTFGRRSSALSWAL